jgi:DNA-binding SARP family transcriptional activator
MNESPQSPALHIQLLGDFRLAYDSTPMTSINTARLQSLLAYLVLHRNAPQPRHYLAFLFWPDSTEAQAHTNLRNLLYHLRQALPEADRFLYADSQTLQWRADAPFTLDVADFESALAQAEQAGQTGDQVALRTALEEAVGLYGGDLLPSCYDDWILPERERLRQAFTEALERLILLLEDQRDYRAAIGYAQRLLRHDPLHEATCGHLMRLQALSGDRAGALRTYHTSSTSGGTGRRLAPGGTTSRVGAIAGRLAGGCRRRAALCAGEGRSRHRQDAAGGGTAPMGGPAGNRHCHCPLLRRRGWVSLCRGGGLAACPSTASPGTALVQRDRPPPAGTAG